MKLCVLGVFLTCASAHGALLYFAGDLTGAGENPPVATPGAGFAMVSYDTVMHTLRVEVQFWDLIGTTTAAHIHCCVDSPGNVGVAVQPGTFTGFPLGVVSGTYDATMDLTLLANYTGGFVSNFGGGTVGGAEAALVAGLMSGRAYLNVHSTFRPGGEIRDFLQPVPEPGTTALIGAGLAGLAMLRARRRM